MNLVAPVGCILLPGYRSLRIHLSADLHDHQVSPLFFELYGIALLQYPKYLLDYFSGYFIFGQFSVPSAGINLHRQL